MKKIYAIFVVTIFILMFSSTYTKEYERKKNGKLNSEGIDNITKESSKELTREELKEQLKKEIIEELRAALILEIKKEIADEINSKIPKEKKEEESTKLVEKEKIVVVPFVNRNKNKDNSQLDRLTSLIEEKMLESSEYEVINRNELDRIVEEQKMALYGITDENSAAKIGKIAGAKKSVMGSLLGFSVNKTRNGVVAEIVMDIKIIDIETAQIFETINLREVIEAPVANIAINSAIDKAGRDFAKKLRGEKIDTNFEAEEYLKKIDIIKENKKTWEIGTYYVLTPFKSGSFTYGESFIEFNKKTQSNLNGVGIELSRENIFTNFEYSSGGEYNLAKLGIGLKKNIVKIYGMDINAGIEGDIAFLNGEIGRTTYVTEISSKSFAEGSKIKMSKAVLGVTPFVKCNLNLSDNISLFLTGEYRLYQKVKDYTIEIEDGSKEEIKIDGLKNSMSLSGAGVKAGISYKF